MEIKNISKTINGKLLLDNISLTINPGEIVGLVGRNGVGKTTLFRTVMGYYTPDSGTVEIDNQPLLANPRLKAKIFMLQDQLHAWDGYKVKTIKKFYQKTYPNFNGAKFDVLLRQVKLNPQHKLGTYSKGMSGLFGLILALSIGAEYLLLDEPMEGLDIIAQKKIMQILLEEVDKNQLGIIISSHRLQELEPIADYIHILKDNSIAKTYHLETMREQAVKLQIAFKEKKLPALLLEHGTVIQQFGRVYTLLIPELTPELRTQFQALDPIFMDELAVTLEDLFLYHLGDEEEVYAR
ncbi:ATP-binding cassette domain-containing protein [Listeria grayi]|uniref:ABC transporter, ATP-binding protein n=2 Tax=Listeria grayi TaxID=1641 RepID=D7UWQ3_LISGR|nr:ABC transporter ATP-binding protein [Listeria grayi]EFI84111.1 ABC transporter, ATP-binding protein [Listeria grayi DSM 20601]MBC1921688.1 ABC transporter ATP-binding protein [Listeria grayi]STY45129.1 Aliphatic sulfonates import ATP-binding protein SsuB [Listeria grayi]